MAELDLDLEVAQLAEVGLGAAFAADASDPGDRLLASGGRISGAPALMVALAALRAAALAAGWDQAGCSGRPPASAADPEHREGLEGRERALRGAIADALVLFAGASAAPMRAAAYPCPAGALAFAAAPGGCTARVRFLAAGASADAARELGAALRAAGYGASW